MEESKRDTSMTMSRNPAHDTNWVLQKHFYSEKNIQNGEQVLDPTLSPDLTNPI